jgi:CBS-domain-containing membrane protein
VAHEKELIMYGTKVADVMTRNVLTVGQKTPFKDIVEILADAGIGAVPVLDPNGTVLGVVSEADLLRSRNTRMTSTSGARRYSPDTVP